MAIPTKDSLLVAWGSNFGTKVTASPLTYNLTAAQATAFNGAYTPFVTAYDELAAAREAGTRSMVLTATKDAAKTELLRIGRELYALVQDSLSVSAADKQDVGVVVRDLNPTPTPPPAQAPGIEIRATVGNTVKIRLFDVADSARRGKPLGVIGASVFSFVGASAPTEESAWTFEGNTGLTRLDITFPPETAPGARVWFTAYWFNQRKQRGPAANPAGTNIPGGAAMAA